jgi:pyruvate dehydrogenase E2 component (dihydrolipoamide acetyltransferase)
MPDATKQSKLQAFLESFGPVKRQAVEKMQRIGARRLTDSWGAIPHVTQHDDADVTAVESWRADVNLAASEAASASVSLLALVAGALSRTLRSFPIFNSSLDMETGDLIVRDYINIGLAIDTTKGVVIGVVRDCHHKSPVQISAEIQELANKARNSKLSLSEMSGSCFTITSLGALGGRYFTPIINSPEVAILGLSAIQELPKRGNQDELVWRKALPMSLSYDHRVVNGADAGRFLKNLIEQLAVLPEAR